MLPPNAALLDNNEHMSHEAEVTGYTESLKEQWDVLLEKIEEKAQKLREANQQQQFNEAVNDMDFWLGEVTFPFVIHIAKYTVLIYCTY